MNVELLEKAANSVVKMVQLKSFGEEIRILSANSDSRIELYKRGPFLDSDGLLRVGGRLGKSRLSHSEAHPLVLPKQNHISEAIILLCHENVAQGGRGMTLNNLRQNRFWILSASVVVRGMIYRCVNCPKLRGSFGVQKMADLPKVRCLEVPPFTHCEVNMFGPHTIRERRSELKRHCALITCFASRAVHIEVTNALDTDSFIQALRRFIARRVPVRSFRSDNGTNFVGAANELRKALDEIDHEQVKDYLQKNGSDWITWENNPPAASHMGGIWESQIRTARTILNTLLKTHSCSLNDENIRTLLAETEEINNSRPLSDVYSQIPLSPSNLLTQKTSVVLPPPGNFDRQDLYSRRRLLINYQR